MKLRVTLDIEFKPTEDREEDEPIAEEHDAIQIADLICGHVEQDEEMWGGSMVWSRVEHAAIVEAEWRDE